MSRVIKPGSDEWPHALEEMAPLDPPEHLYVDGRPLSSDDKAVAIVGTRRPTAAGLETAERFAAAFAEAGFTVVSGLAIGIDAAAHRAALRKGGRTVAVLGCGLDIDYPSSNTDLRRRIAEAGTLVTEYEAGVQPQPFHFPRRNRIIAGLVKGVLVVEGGERSGAMITARLALDANRQIWAVPGSVRNRMADAPNLLIRTGQAGLVTDPKHVFDDLAPGLVWEERAAASPACAVREPDDLAVLGYLDDVPVIADRIAETLRMPDGRVSLALARLEIRGLIRRRAGGYEVTEAGVRSRATLPGVT